MLSKFVGKFRRFFAFDELLKQLIIRDVKLKYRRSYLGYLWSILNPLMLMMVLVVIFSNLFRFDIPNFPLYMISGQFLFSFMTEATNMSVGSITGNSALIKKTYVPKYIFTVSKVGSSLVNLLFSLGALLLVMIFTDAEFSWNLLFFPVIILEVFIFSLGLGLWLSAITVFSVIFNIYGAYLFQCGCTSLHYSTPYRSFRRNTKTYTKMQIQCMAILSNSEILSYMQNFHRLIRF